MLLSLRIAFFNCHTRRILFDNEPKREPHRYPQEKRKIHFISNFFAVFKTHSLTPSPNASLSVPSSFAGF